MKPIVVTLTMMILASPCAATGLQPLSFLAGHCWSGELAGGEGRDTHCYSWIYDGKFLRDVHVVKGKGEPYCGESIYHADPDDDAIHFTYYNSLGGISRGRLNVTPEGLRSPAEHYEGPDGSTMLIRSRLVPGDNGQSYVSVSERERDGAWETARRVEFHQAPDLDPRSALTGACSGQKAER